MRFIRHFSVSLMIIFSISGRTHQQKQHHYYSPTNYDEVLPKLLQNHFFLNSSDEFSPFSIGKVKDASKLLDEIDQFCSINHQNISISDKCCRDVKFIIYSFITGKEWATKIVDSLAKPPSGILEGKVFFPGDYKECKNIMVDGALSFTPKYCQARVPASYKKKKFDLTFGLCVPNSCSVTDCEHLFLEGLHMLPYHLGDQLNATVYCPQKPNLDAKAIVAIIVCLALFALVFLGTLVDVLVIKQTEDDSSFSAQSPSINDAHETGSEICLVQPASTQVFAHGKKFFLCFSILKNVEKLLKTKLPEGNLPAIHGIRFLSMTWVILGHTYFFGISTVGNTLTLLDMSKRFTFQAITMAIYSVDTFFLLSGMLVAYGMLKFLTEKQGKMNWIYFYVHRFYRLTPTYLVLLMIYVCLLKYFGNGPYWHPGIDKDCSQNWWWNLLYSNNFLTNGGCMGWTWYLANDMQFYLISPVIVILLYKFPKVGIFLTLILLCAEFITSAILFTNGKLKSPVSSVYMNVYMMPYCRIGPYLIGLLLGYVLHVTNGQNILNRIFVCCMWFVSFVISMAIIYGFYNTDNGNSLSQPVATLYWTLSHTVWAMCVGWVIFACCSGHGGIVNRILSWKAFIPLSRLTYCAYLIHPMVMLIYNLNLLYPMVITDIMEMYVFLGHLVISYGFAFMASMLIEAPLMKIESVFFPRK